MKHRFSSLLMPLSPLGWRCRRWKGWRRCFPCCVPWGGRPDCPIGLHRISWSSLYTITRTHDKSFDGFHYHTVTRLYRVRIWNPCGCPLPSQSIHANAAEMFSCIRKRPSRAGKALFYVAFRAETPSCVCIKVGSLISRKNEQQSGFNCGNGEKTGWMYSN